MSTHSVADMEKMLEQKFKEKVRIIQSEKDIDDSVNPSYTICVSDNLEPYKVLELALEKNICQVVQESNPEFEKELNTSALMLLDKNQFVENPISAILTPDNCSEEQEQSLTMLNLDFDKAADKHKLLEDIEGKLADVSKSGSFKSEILSILDELITNAVFNAPFVDKDNSSSGASRTDHSISMEKGKCANVFMGTDDSRLVIGVADPYGTLNIMRLFSKVRDCYDDVAENINMDGGGGAGIGSFMVYNACASYYAAVKDGFATMIVCSVPLKMSGSKRAQIPKNLHYFNV